MSGFTGSGSSNVKVEYNNILKVSEGLTLQHLSVSSLSRLSHLFKVHVGTVTVSDSPFNIQQTINMTLWLLTILLSD